MYPIRRRTIVLLLATAYPLIVAAADNALPASAAGEEAIVVDAAETGAADQAPEVVVVRSQRQNYFVLTATGATKTDTLLKDLPQSVRVITADMLRDVGVTTLANALDLASGISRQSNNGGLW